jgi:hypothetical protein
MKAQTESGKAITIDDRYEIKRGGEGKILTIPELPDQVAKIYLNPNYKHMSKAQKDALSVLDGSLFVKPLELIYEKKGSANIIGFTMEYLSPDFVPLAAFFNKNYCAAYSVDEAFKSEVAQKLIKSVASAHSHEVIIGDLSGLNVLVDLQKEVRFLDTDSYETPVHSHWGLLFDEIRDYLYQGKVSKESDYFALSVIIFNLFTYLHPFKGIHKIIKAMAERMIRKIPVFTPDPDLIIPKCYQPLTDIHLQEQFEEIFAGGKRFLLQIGKQVVVINQPAVLIPTILIKTTLKYKEIYRLQPNEYIQKAHFTQKLGYIQTNQKTLVYDTSNQGYLTLKHTFDATEGEILVGNQCILCRKEDDLAVWQEGIGWQTLSNIHLTRDARLIVIDTILVVLQGDFMRFVHIDEVIQDQIRVDQTPTFTQGFDTLYGMVQHTGGVQYVFYNSGKNISTVKSAVTLQSVRIVGNAGIAVYEIQQSGEVSIAYEYFVLENLQMRLKGEKISGLRQFAYKATSTQGGLIFEPTDDAILVRKTEDCKVIQAMECSLLSTESNLVMTTAGIVAFERDFCYLLNT